MKSKIMRLTGAEYKSFLLSKKSFFMLFSFIFMAEDIVGKMKELSVETGFRINKTEPFLLILSYGTHAVLIPVMFIVLMSGFPGQGNSSVFPVIRLGRKRWLLGELIYAWLVGISYLIFLLAGSILWMGGTGGFENGWSPYMTQLYMDFPEKYVSNNHLFIREGTVTQGAPAEVMMHGMLLMSLYMLFLAQLLCLFKLLHLKNIGIVITIGIVIVSQAAVSYFGKIKWILPMAHAIYGEHYNLIFLEQECSLGMSYLYFAVLNLVLLAVNFYRVKYVIIGDAE